MRNHSIFGGRHELGQNFLTHRPTINRIVRLVTQTHGPVLEIGAGDGALTGPLSKLGRPLTAIDIDLHRVKTLRNNFPGVSVEHADVLKHPLDRPVVVGNIPFHITTPILRRLLAGRDWQRAIVLTQWEVARKRAGVGGSTMMTAQAGPWYTFELHGRVPSHAFSPRPSVDGGILFIKRRDVPLVHPCERDSYEKFVGMIFSGRGRGISAILRTHLKLDPAVVRSSLKHAFADKDSLPRDLIPEQWAALWEQIDRSGTIS